MSMKGSLSDGKDGSTSLDAYDCGGPVAEFESRLRKESFEAKEGASKNVGSNDKSEIGDENGNDVDENAMNSTAPEENQNEGGMEEEEQWDLKKIMSIAAVVRKSPIKCSHEACTLVAATVWVSNLKPSESWYSCLDCQVRQPRF
jgi:hypothetical protein